MSYYNYPTGPCPMCGKPDSARMGSTTWGHGEMCCSDECGRAFLTSTQRCELELSRARARVTAALQEMHMWQEALELRRKADP